MRELSPLLVTSPSVRSGTTLLQRLLCSAGNALVYGEEIGKDLELQLQIFASRKLVYGHSRQRFTSDMQRVVQGGGDGDGWMLDLMPDIDGYLQALYDGAFAGLAHCRQHAESAGRPIWGFKYPGWPPHLVRLLFDAMPGTHVICIVRDLADTARSAKAWGAIGSEEQMQPFCAQWLHNLAFLRQWQKTHPVLMLSYEALVAEPGRAIAQLRGFLPFDAMDLAVLERRINNTAAAIDTRRAHGYIEPLALTVGEQSWVDAAMASAGQVGRQAIG
jgi:hypothetical protein